MSQWTEEQLEAWRQKAVAFAKLSGDRPPDEEELDMMVRRMKGEVTEAEGHEWLRGRFAKIASGEITWEDSEPDPLRTVYRQ